MRLQPTSGWFLLGLAIGAASILALRFLDMWIHEEKDWHRLSGRLPF